MTDQQLLELAAKAVGMPSLHDANGIYGAWVGDSENGHWWNPLEDDGDALRLAVALEMQLRLQHSGNEVYVYGAPSGRVDESVIGDPLAATRRAIVRAAAEIGQAMQEGK